MDIFTNQRTATGLQALQSNSTLWNLESRAPNPTCLFSDVVNDITSDWVLLYTVPEGTFIELQELQVYNGASGTTEWRVAIVNPNQTPPTGNSENQANIYFSGSLATKACSRNETRIGMSTGWRIYGWSDAAAGDYLNMLLSGLVVSYLS